MTETPRPTYNERTVPKETYKVICGTHGVIAITADAKLGLTIFLAHAQIHKGCTDPQIIPNLPHAKLPTPTKRP